MTAQYRNAGGLTHWSGVDFEPLSPTEVQQVLDTAPLYATFARTLVEKLNQLHPGEGFTVGPLKGDGLVTPEEKAKYLRGAISNNRPKITYRNEYGGRRIFSARTRYGEDGELYFDVVRRSPQP